MSIVEKAVQRGRDDAPLHAFAAMGLEVRILVSTDESGGTQSVSEFAFAGPFSGPPVHWHRYTAETFVCLEGRFTMILDGQERPMRPGDIAYVPPGVLHTYVVEHEGPTRYLLVCTPGGHFEQYVADAAVLAADAFAQGRPVDGELLRAIRGRYETYDADVPRF